MKLFLASMHIKVLAKFYDIFGIKMNILLSYAYKNAAFPKFMVQDRDKIDGLILDSGAWTLNNKKSNNKTMNVPKDLIFYCQDVEKYFNYIFNYDSDFHIRGFEINYTNQVEMEKAGLSPVPVVHNYYGKEEINHYIKRGCKRVALGSFEGRDLHAIDYATQRLKDHGIKIHLFKMGSYATLSRLPIDSADASSWAQHAKFGCIIIWNPNKPGEDKTEILRMPDYLIKDNKNVPYFDEYPLREEIEELIYDTTSITYNDLMGLDAHLYRQVLNTFYYTQIQDIINNKTSV
jgi:hypothetical protein